MQSTPIERISLPGRCSYKIILDAISSKCMAYTIYPIYTRTKVAFPRWSGAHGKSAAPFRTSSCGLHNFPSQTIKQNQRTSPKSTHLVHLSYYWIPLGQRVIGIIKQMQQKPGPEGKTTCNFQMPLTLPVLTCWYCSSGVGAARCRADNIARFAGSYDRLFPLLSNSLKKPSLLLVFNRLTPRSQYSAFGYVKK